MCQSIKNCFYDKLTFEKLLEALKRAKKGKSNKIEILKYEIDLETNIMNLYNKLKEGTYKMGKYRCFTIFEPKERLIKSLPFEDRKWYVEEFIKPFILPRFIYDTYACIDSKGMHMAVDRLQMFMHKMHFINPNYYVLKCDIKKYFYSIDKDVLFKIMNKYITDKKLIELTKIFIYDDSNKLGIPIGNYTSQFFANIYLNELDHYITDVLKVKYYVRYMDDFVLLIDNKVKAKEILNKINIFIINELKLILNEKTRYYPNKLGIDFCGYRIFENYRKLRKRSVKKIKNKIKKWNNDYKLNQFDKHQFILCYNSFKGHAMHANTFNLKEKLESKFLWDL